MRARCAIPLRPRRGPARGTSTRVGPRRETRPPPPPTFCATGRQRRFGCAAARARPRRHTTRSHPFRRVWLKRRWEPHASAPASPSHLLGDARASVKDDSRCVSVGSFEHVVFSRGFSRPRVQHDARRIGSSGKGLLERFAPRGLCRAVAEAPPPMACAAECAGVEAQCAPKPVQRNRELAGQIAEQIRLMSHPVG